MTGLRPEHAQRDISNPACSRGRYRRCEPDWTELPIIARMALRDSFRYAHIKLCQTSQHRLRRCRHADAPQQVKRQHGDIPTVALGECSCTGLPHVGTKVTYPTLGLGHVMRVLRGDCGCISRATCVSLPPSAPPPAAALGSAG